VNLHSFDYSWILFVTSNILYSFSSLLCSAIKLNNVNASIHIDAVIDPLSPTGQKLSPLLHILWRQIQPSMRIVLNPVVRNFIFNLFCNIGINLILFSLLE
jgi:hypothetical protein